MNGRGKDVNLTTTQLGYNPANAQILDQKVSNFTVSVANLRNSFLFKSTIFPNKKVKGLAYIKELPGFISTPNGNFSTSGIKIIGVGINIKFGGNSHSISFKMPQS